MARNSFSIRSWTVTFLVGILVVSVAGNSEVTFRLGLLGAAFLILGMFWVLDGYFLALARRYQDLYDEVRMQREWKIDFEMISEQSITWTAWVDAILSITLRLFYLPMFLVTVIVYGYLIGISTGLIK